MQPDPFSGQSGDLSAPEDVLRRLRWRARRGMLENDLIIERFFARWESGLSVAEHDGLARLLDLTDNDLMDLLLDRRQPHGELDRPEVLAVLAKLRAV